MATYDLAEQFNKVKVVGTKGGTPKQFLEILLKELDEVRKPLGTS